MRLDRANRAAPAQPGLERWADPAQQAAGVSPRPSGSGRRTTVLHVRTFGDNGGGPEKTILSGAAHFADSPYRIIAAYLHAPGNPGLAELRRRAAELGCPLIALPDHGPWDLSVVARLARLCRRLRVGVWHGHEYKSNLLGLLLRPLQPMRLVSTVHGWVVRTARTPLYYAVDRWCLARYDRVISVSDELDREVAGLGLPAARRRLLPNGIDSRVFQRRLPAQQAPLRQRLGLPPGRLVIGGVGRLSEEKGFDLLIEAGARLQARGHDLEVWLAGVGPAGPSLVRLAARRGFGDRLRLLGYQAEPVEVFEALDLFALSSRREGLPNVLLEALALELPAVASRVGGVEQLVEDGVNGLLCPPDDLAALSAALDRLLGDPALRERLGRAGRARVVERFSFAQRMRGERELYDELLSAHR
jgi:glycosyltransferase involved in cell wall biosynthesis